MADYDVENDRHGDAEIVRLRAPGATTAEIVPAWGGSAFSFRVGATSVLENISLAEIAKKPTSYGVPILFPFPNRIRDGRFAFEGREFHIDPPRHGMVRDKPWAVV